MPLMCPYDGTYHSTLSFGLTNSLVCKPMKAVTMFYSSWGRKNLTLGLTGKVDIS